jgi:RHS repeat-associated protein
MGRNTYVEPAPVSGPWHTDRRSTHYAGIGACGRRNTLQGGGRQRTLRHRYDELGNRVATTLPDGRVLNTLVYGSGHVHQFNVDGQIISDVERDALHREVTRSQGLLRSTRQYDVMGRLQAQQVQRVTAPAAAVAAPVGARQGRTARDGAAIQRLYRYDAAGQLSQMQDWRHSVSYGYDPLGQLLSADEERFAFDPAHNLLPGSATPRSGAQGSAGRVERNRLLVFEDQRFSYDAHGRMATKRSGAHRALQLHWNAEHQLERSVLQHLGQPTVTTGYAYDPFGRRLYKAPLDAQGQVIAQEATWFVWDGNRLLQELKTLSDDSRTAARSLTQTYVYEPDTFVPLAQLRTEASLAEPAAQAAQAIKPLRLRVGRDATAAVSTVTPSAHEPGQVHYYHCDQIGTPRELTASDGHITWQATYRAWGNTQTVQWEAPPHLDAHGEAANAATWHDEQPDRSELQPLRFQGQYFDVETGLHYNRFRYYDPGAGRFVSQDPIGLAGGVNVHSYVPTPTAWIDPLGLACVKFKRWKTGDAIDKPLPDGSTPKWDVVRSRYWKNRAMLSDPTEFTAVNRSRMGLGRAPIDLNGRPLELHHDIPQRMGGPSINNPRNLRELTREQHAAIDPCRYL